MGGSRARALNLRALGYPVADTFAVEDSGGFRKLIVWLEDTKIRLYKPEERKQLRATGAHAAWEAAFARYLHEQRCPLASQPDARAAVLDWLLQQAVSFEYRDNAESLNAMAAKLAPPKEDPAANRGRKAGPSGGNNAKPSANLPMFTDLSSPAVTQALVTLAQLLRVLPTDPPAAAAAADDPAALLKMVVSAANRMLTPAALEAATVAGDWENHSTGGGVFGFSSDHFPLGFECDDAQLKGAATLLRVLFVNDLRNLQTQVDRLIVEMQEYTADPKTDAKLGRVGI